MVSLSTPFLRAVFSAPLRNDLKQRHVFSISKDLGMSLPNRFVFCNFLKNETRLIYLANVIKKWPKWRMCHLHRKLLGATTISSTSSSKNNATSCTVESTKKQSYCRFFVISQHMHVFDAYTCTKKHTSCS